jgi:bacterioferritin
MPQFVRDVEEIRQRATNKIEEGAVTNAYKGDVEKTISILNEALATEIVCVLRYMHHYFMATGVHGKSVADEFKEHADAERGHADMIGERIQQLGGKPDFNPKSLLERSVSQYIEGETLAEMIREDLIAERIVIEVYQGMIRHFSDNDPTTRVMLEQILKDEEEHASDLADLLYIVDPETGRTEGEDPGTNPLKRQHGQRQPASGDGHARVESNGGTRSPQSARMQAEPPAQRRQSSTKQQGTQEPPDFYPTSDVDEELKRKKALKAGTSGTLVEKRQASREAGSPGAPEFSATARHVLTKQRPGTERKPEKGSKAASPTRKRKIA